MRAILLLLLLALPAAAEPLAELEWLAGSWATRGPGDRTEEHWTPPAGGRMFGVNRSYKDGGLKTWEHIVIESRPDGVVYLASPEGRQPPTEFHLTEAGPGRAVFENPEHDFPQKIVYQLEDGNLKGSIHGGGLTVEWVWARE